MVMGTPCRRPSSLPLARCLSAACAAFSASSLRSTTTAFSLGLTARIRSRCASTVSTPEIAPARIAAAVSTADHCQAGPLGRGALRRGLFVLRGVVFLAGLASGLLRAKAVLPDVFANAFFEALFFLATVFFATSHLLKLRGRRLRREIRPVQRRFRMAHRRDTPAPTNCWRRPALTPAAG